MMRVSGSYAVTVALIGSSLALSKLADSRKPEALRQPLARIGLNLDGWNGAEEPRLEERMERSLGATAYLSRSYRRQDKELDAFVAFYANQRAGESMHSPKYCLPGTGWEPVDVGEVAVEVEGRQVHINRYRLYKDGQRVLVLYWYQTAERIIASEYMVKGCLIWDAALRGHTSGSVVRLTLSDVPGSMEDGLAFARRIIPEVRRCLP